MRKLVSVFALAFTIAALTTGVAFGHDQGTERHKLKARGSGTTSFTSASTFIADGTAHWNLGTATFHTDGVLTGPTTFTSIETDVFRNGDTLTFSSTGTFTATTFKQHDTYTGGTGRFKGARGSSTTTGTTPATPDPNVFLLTFRTRGTIILQDDH